MSGWPLRFAVVATPTGDGRGWARQAAQLDADGWDALLVPDTLATASPFPALAAAAAVSERIRLRTWVLAAPLRSTAATVRECRALQELSDGRFEAGLGTGRPHAEHEAAALGVPWPAAAERIEQVQQAVTAVRAGVRPVPPVAIAASGPRMTQAAAAAVTAPEAGPDDRIVLALPPTADESALSAAAARVHEAAGRLVRSSLQVVAVGGQVSPAFARWGGPDAASLATSRAAAVLPPDPDEALAILRDRADRLGINEVVVPVDLVAAATPLLQRAR
jgi:alkanesulfonate monooxygenase SsuD/methylene tetrahydromethanopterin reductase-like flavin-dependent oxidoreductase (luciferase family)